MLFSSAPHPGPEPCPRWAFSNLWLTDIYPLTCPLPVLAHQDLWCGAPYRTYPQSFGNALSETDPGSLGYRKPALGVTSVPHSSPSGREPKLGNTLPTYLWNHTTSRAVFIFPSILSITDSSAFRYPASNPKYLSSLNRISSPLLHLCAFTVDRVGFLSEAGSRVGILHFVRLFIQAIVTRRVDNRLRNQKIYHFEDRSPACGRSALFPTSSFILRLATCFPNPT